MTGTLIFLLVPLYVLSLFALAWWSDRHPGAENPQLRAVIWGLSTAVYTGSWIFFSGIGAVSRAGWGFTTTFAGAALTFAIFFPVIIRIAKVVKRENIVSFADFLSSRYGKSRVVGVLVTVFALLFSMPFIAQQLRALAMAWSVMLHTNSSSLAVLTIAAVLAGFVILFGAHRPTLTEHNHGLVRVIATESLVKLVILMTVTIMCLLFIGHSSSNDWRQHLGALAQPPQFDFNFLNGLLVGMAGILCAPRQFYLGFVQLENLDDLKRGRWILVSYLLLGCLLTLPIAVAGTIMFNGVGSDMYILKLSQNLGSELFTVIVFVGGFSCVAAAIMAETVALSAMISNELVLPLLARTRFFHRKQGIEFGRLLVYVRRAAICILLLLGWIYSQSMNITAGLGGMGTLSALGVVQFLPVFLGGLFWRRGHASGAIAGLCGGFFIWFYMIAGPQLFRGLGLDTSFVFRFAGTQNGVLPWPMIGLLVSTALYVVFSLAARPRLIDRVQASAFIDVATRDRMRSGSIPALRGTVGDLKALVAQFIGESATSESFEELQKFSNSNLHDKESITPALARATQRILAGVVGSSFARRIMGWQLTGGTWEASDVLGALDDAAEAVQFNREVLQTTIDHLAQGVYVVDRSGHVIAWNARIIELFALPADFFHVGQPISDFLRFALAASGSSQKEIDNHVETRLAHIRQAVPYEFERERSDGRVLKISGSGIPGGGYVTSFTDITELRRGAQALKQVNEKLEERVTARTYELMEANTALADANAALANANLALSDAKNRAEKTSNSQARFLAAASHDLLQPLHAARLFMGALREELPEQNSGAQEMATNADLSIESANRLLRALLNLSRLEVGGIKLEVRPVSVGALLKDLLREFGPVAVSKGLALRVVHTDAWVLSDPDLLRSVLQNLLGNAIRYTQSGSVVIGGRRENGSLRFEILDSGPGIPDGALGVIFEEFSRLPGSVETGPGAGLGLAIADRVCKLLGHKLMVRSTVGKGSIFSVTVPRTHAMPVVPAMPVPGSVPTGIRILCVENDAAVLHSMESLLVRWGAHVTTATSMSQALSLKGEWDVVLADYHLENDGNGLDLIEAMSNRANIFALITADQSEETLSRAVTMGIEVIAKPLAPAFLRIFLSRALRLRNAAE